MVINELSYTTTPLQISYLVRYIFIKILYTYNDDQ